MLIFKLIGPAYIFYDTAGFKNHHEYKYGTKYNHSKLGKGP